MSSPRRFLVGLLCAPLLALPFLILAVLVDPTGALRSHWPGKPQLCVPATRVDPRIAWPFRLKSSHPEEVLLGTSRVLHGFSSTATKRQLGDHVFNLALSGARLEEMESLFVMAVSTGSLKRAWVGLDYGMFTSDGHSADTQVGASWFDALRVSFRLDSVLSSIRAIASDQECRAPTVDPQGFQDEAIALSRIRQTGWRLTVQTSRMAMRAGFATTATSQSDHRANRSRERWGMLKRMVRVASESDVRLVFMVNPSHKDYVEAIDNAGLSAAYRQWRKQLSLFAEQHSIPLFDWSDLALTMNADIDNCDPTTDERCPLFDVNHARPIVGELLMERMLAQLQASPNP